MLQSNYTTTREERLLKCWNRSHDVMFTELSSWLSQRNAELKRTPIHLKNNPEDREELFQFRPDATICCSTTVVVYHLWQHSKIKLWFTHTLTHYHIALSSTTSTSPSAVTNRVSGGRTNESYGRDRTPHRLLAPLFFCFAATRTIPIQPCSVFRNTPVYKVIER